MWVMKKVLIIGSPGAGKSTFARRLRTITDLPLYYLDQIWHCSDGTHILEQAFDKQLERLLQKDQWIIDGNYSRTLERRLAACDTVFLLDYPVEVCLLGAASRIGHQREDLPWIEREFDADFKQHILDFPQKRLPYLYEQLAAVKLEKTIIVFKSRDEAQLYLKRLANKGRCVGDKRGE